MKKHCNSLRIFFILFCLANLSAHAQVCTGVAANTAIASPGLLCPGSTATVGLMYPYANSGITYQWWVSNVSTVGPFTVVSGATLTTYTTPQLSVNCWYTCQIICANASATA